MVFLHMIYDTVSNLCFDQWGYTETTHTHIHKHAKSLHSFQGISETERLALQVVSYIGCAVSVICLIITIIYFLMQGQIGNT